MPRCKDDVSATAAASCTDAARELQFRRSLRTSRARRAAAVVRRRRTLRSRGSAMMAAVGLFMLTAGSIASTGGAEVGPSLSTTAISAVQRALGLEVDGVIGPVTRRAVKRFQREHDLKADGLLGPKTLKALGIAADDQQVASAALDPRLAAIAQCESGGDPQAMSADGRYYGKYQFSLTSWRSVGGKGNPAKAPEAEQDRRAAKLLARDGTAPWPNCA